MKTVPSMYTFLMNTTRIYLSLYLRNSGGTLRIRFVAIENIMRTRQLVSKPVMSPTCLIFYFIWNLLIKILPHCIASLSKSTYSSTRLNVFTEPSDHSRYTRCPRILSQAHILKSSILNLQSTMNQTAERAVRLCLNSLPFIVKKRRKKLYIEWINQYIYCSRLLS